MISRHLTGLIEQHKKDPKAIIILGPRQAGKTTLLKSIFEGSKEKILWFDGDDTDL